MRSPKRARHASAARRASGVRRPCSSMPAPMRSVSRQVSRRKIWSPSTRPTSSRKLFEPMSTTASVSARRTGVAAWQRQRSRNDAALPKRAARRARIAFPRAAAFLLRSNDRTPRCSRLRHAHRLPAEDPDRQGLRRRDRVAARARADAVAAPRQPRAAEARGPAAGVLVQAARRVQQDGAPVAGRARARRDRGLRRQSRAGRRARRAEARLQGDDRDAGDDAAHQDRRGRGARRQGRAARRLVQRRLRARARAAEVARARRSSIRTTIPT